MLLGSISNTATQVCMNYTVSWNLFARYIEPTETNFDETHVGNCSFISKIRYSQDNFFSLWCDVVIICSGYCSLFIHCVLFIDKIKGEKCLALFFLKNWKDFEKQFSSLTDKGFIKVIIKFSWRNSDKEVIDCFRIKFWVEKSRAWKLSSEDS